MSIVQMQRINLVALKKNRKAILERLQAMGAVEIDIRLDDDTAYETQDVSHIRSDFEKRSRMADAALDVLQRHVPEKTGLLNALEGKPFVEKEMLDTLAEQQERYMDLAETLISLDKQMAETTADIQNLQNQIEGLTPWLGLDIPMNYTGTRETSVLIGTLPGRIDLETIWLWFKSSEPQIEAADVEILSKDKDFTYVFVISMKNEAAWVEEVLRAKGFAKPVQLSEQVMTYSFCIRISL